MTVTSIFISSVQKELQAERRAVKAFVEGDPLLRRYFTAFLFEDLPYIMGLVRQSFEWQMGNGGEQ